MRNWAKNICYNFSKTEYLENIREIMNFLNIF